MGAGVQSNYKTLEHNMRVTYYLMFDVNVSEKKSMIFIVYVSHFDKMGLY